MAAQTANIRRERAGGPERLQALPAKASTILYAGSLIVSDDATGLAEPGTDVAAKTFVGVCWTGLDNSAGAAGTMGAEPERIVEVERNMYWSFPVNGATPLAGQDALLFDDGTVSAAATTANLKVGRFIEPNAKKSGDWFVDIRGGVA